MPRELAEGEAPKGPLESAFDAHIEPLMEKLHELCVKHGIPMVMHFQLDAHPGKGIMSAGASVLEPIYTDMRLRILAMMAQKPSLEVLPGTIDQNGKVELVKVAQPKPGDSN